MANINDYVIGILHRRVQGINLHIYSIQRHELDDPYIKKEVTNDRCAA